MRLAIISSKELRTPPLGYGGIERLAYDLAMEMKQIPGVEVDLYGVPGEPEVIPHSEFYLENKTGKRYDAIIDFTHLKDYELYDVKSYAAVPFHPDPASNRYNFFPTKVTKDAYSKVGTVIIPGIRYPRINEKLQDYAIFIGRLDPLKRPDIAIKTARHLGLNLILIGHTGKFVTSRVYLRNVLDMIDGDQIRLLEGISEFEKYSTLAQARVTLLPSDWSIIKSIESLGITAIEAMIYGVPVVTSGEGMCELVNYVEGGTCCNKGDLECFINETRRWYQASENTRKRIKENARRLFSASRYARDVYKEIRKIHEGSG